MDLSKCRSFFGPTDVFFWGGGGLQVPGFSKVFQGFLGFFYGFSTRDEK